MQFGSLPRHSILLSCVVAIFVACRLEAAGAEPVDFSRDIRPLLSQHCFACHGPDEGGRQANLRLDRVDAAYAETSGGTRAIVPGHPETSELLVRITSNDADLRMPPAATGNRLSANETELLRRWIQEGAKFDDHWSFRPIATPQPPAIKNSEVALNPIDLFVRARLDREKIMPSPEAGRPTLVRRLSLDLLGLPPTPEELTAFVSDASPNAYEKLVDRILTSPHFGERWGRHWLDLAHYADSDGYLGDGFRNYAWLYRDWVIDAINRDLSFDRFTIEQLAGDLLPNASLAERTATGFLRNTMRNTEAGVDLEEYRLKEIVDRVSTVGIGWLGLSLGCAECHSHKFDPISHREFYQLFAFFNDADDVDVPTTHPDEQAKYQSQMKVWLPTQTRLTAAIDAAFTQGEKLREALAIEAKKRTNAQTQLIESQKTEADEAARKLCDEYEAHARKKPILAIKAMTVAKRKATRTSYIHLRGDYRSRGEEVKPGTLAVLPPLQSRDAVADRLDLANWLVESKNPLTPRVTVNHLWKHMFGRGLVATVDNFGSGGDAPSHPELLEWLAQEFIQQGWSRKAMIRLMVTSATYRQASHMRKELVARDPLNVLLARQSRVRLEAESVRDAALAASGLLEHKIGGPGVRPPQPEYVASISRNADWKVSKGADLYRRGMYIVFRRATPYPMLLTFDAPDSTVACTRRERSNSPLQALTLLNDPVFFECSQALGQILAEGTSRSFDDRLAEGFLRCLGRVPRPQELERMRNFFEERRAAFATDLTAARATLGRPKGKEDAGKVVDQAAWIVTARVLLNLDELINRE